MAAAAMVESVAESSAATTVSDEEPRAPMMQLRNFWIAPSAPWVSPRKAPARLGASVDGVVSACGDDSGCQLVVGADCCADGCLEAGSLLASTRSFLTTSWPPQSSRSSPACGGDYFSPLALRTNGSAEEARRLSRRHDGDAGRSRGDGEDCSSDPSMGSSADSSTDLRNVSDEALLAMLRTMAREAIEEDERSSHDWPSTRGCDSEDGGASRSSGSRFDVVPVEIEGKLGEADGHEASVSRGFDDDADALAAHAAADGAVAAAIAEDETQRLREELERLRDRSSCMCSESARLRERLLQSKAETAARLESASVDHEALRARLGVQLSATQRLRAALSAEGLATLRRPAGELSLQAEALAATQASLVESLSAASATQARLHAELQRERVATWQQSANVVVAFAHGGGAASARGSAAPSARSGCRSARGSASSGTPRTLMSPARSPGRCRASSSSSAPVLSPALMEHAVVSTAAAQAERHRLSQAHQRMLEEHGSRSERQARVTAELKKAIALELASGSRVTAELEHLRRRAAASGLRLRSASARTAAGASSAAALAVASSGACHPATSSSTSATPRGGSAGVSAEDASAMRSLVEAEALASMLEDSVPSLRRSARDARKARDALGAEYTEASALRARLRRCEVESAAVEDHCREARDRESRLRTQVAREQAVLAEKEAQSAEARRRLAAEVDWHMQSFRRLQADTQRRRWLLNGRRGGLCARRCAKRADADYELPVSAHVSAPSASAPASAGATLRSAGSVARPLGPPPQRSAPATYRGAAGAGVGPLDADSSAPATQAMLPPPPPPRGPPPPTARRSDGRPYSQ
eukprot:TRINITY_DN28364_c0_g1_i1.p1 TRINITY_DN28364_c0_g1~~TRINITY_DN28364_c0_g1_i1.p1  ORF type:complete len:825 (-),score=188.97 TRINITY_DN28364_c0_g1_i1:197-2671(-)